MEELDHESSEAFEGSWNADGGADFDQNASSSVYVNLKFPHFVDRRVE